MNANQLLDMATKMQNYVDDYDEAFVSVEYADGRIEWDLNVSNKIIAFGEKHGTFAHLICEHPLLIRNPFLDAQFTGNHDHDHALVVRLSQMCEDAYNKCARIMETCDVLRLGLVV